MRVAALLLLCASLAAAQEPYDIKGDQLGMSLRDFRSRHSGRPVEGLPKGYYINLGDYMPTCIGTGQGLVSCKLPTALELKYFQTVANKRPKDISFHFVDEKLYLIDIIFDHGDMGDVVDAFTRKYGVPTKIEPGQFQVRSGARFDSTRIVWSNKVSTISIKEYTKDLDTSQINVIHTELIQTAAARLPEKRPDL